MNPCGPRALFAADKGDLKMDHFEQIAERAYWLWESAGHPDGRDQEFWFAAESEIRGEIEGGFEAEADDAMDAPPETLPIH